MKKVENLELIGSGLGQDFLTGLGCGLSIGMMAFPPSALVGSLVFVSCVTLIGRWWYNVKCYYYVMLSEKATKNLFILVAILNFIVQFSDSQISLKNWISAFGILLAAIVFYFTRKTNVWLMRINKLRVKRYEISLIAIMILQVITLFFLMNNVLEVNTIIDLFIAPTIIISAYELLKNFRNKG